jgi:AbrB family looped-hinge helix DNA binding protein
MHCRRRLDPGTYNAYRIDQFIDIRRLTMDTVTLSPKYQVVIPLAVREALGLTPGEKLRVIAHDGRVEFVPVRRMRTMRGFLAGIDTAIVREPDRL